MNEFDESLKCEKPYCRRKGSTFTNPDRTRTQVLFLCRKHYEEWVKENPTVQARLEL